MTEDEARRMEGVLIGLLVGLHAAGAVYRWIRGEKTDAAFHAGCTVVEGMAVWRHREDG